MASPKVEVLVKNACGELGEGPHWDESSQTLLFVDIEAKEVHRWFPATGQHDVKKMNDYVGHVVPRAKGGMMVGLGRRFAEIHWESDEMETTEELEGGKETFRFNDGKCDAKGRLWGGTLSWEFNPALGHHTFHSKAGSLYRLDTDRRVSSQHTGLTISNGLAWTADSSTMFLVDSAVKELYAFDFDLEAGTVSNQRTVVTLPADTGLGEANPDGLTIDVDGRLWLACWGGGAVVHLDPATGKCLRVIHFPARQPSSVCWGGANLDELYVTTARKSSPQELQETPLAGSIFKVTGLGTRGHPAFVYQG